jgi:hypothetical protein
LLAVDAAAVSPQAARRAAGLTDPGKEVAREQVWQDDEELYRGVFVFFDDDEEYVIVNPFEEE